MVLENSLIIGLNCGPLPKITKNDIKGGGHIKYMYFNGESKIMRMYINVGFKVSKIGTDSDRLKMAQLYFLESFL